MDRPRKPASIALDRAISAYGRASSLTPSAPFTRSVAELKPEQQRGFSIAARPRGRVMQTPCNVSRPYESMAGDGHGPFNALWDTGSSCCLVSRRVVEACGLRPTGTVRELIVMQGRGPAQTYLGDLILPGGIAFMNVELLEGTSLPDIDVIVGLDVITCGDLSLATSSGKPVLSFRAPAGRIAFNHRPPDRIEAAGTK